jgi:hypothetical protein
MQCHANLKKKKKEKEKKKEYPDNSIKMLAFVSKFIQKIVVWKKLRALGSV